MPVHPAVLEAQLAQALPRNTVMVQASSSARTTLLSFGHAGIEWTRSESYRIVRHNWAKEMPDSKMIREGKSPGLWLSAPATDDVGLGRSRGEDGEAGTTVKEPELRRGMDKIAREHRPSLIGVSVARDGIGVDSTWDQDWQL